jgi:hypothetical protein
MKQWLFRALVLAGLIALGFWGWRAWFPSPQGVIRKRLAELARTASFSSNEGPLAKLANVQKLPPFFANDVEITVDAPGRSQQTYHGRDELLQAAMGARTALSGLTVEFLDVIVSLAPDKEFATANLTAKARVPGEDFTVQELKFTLKKIGGVWLIFRIETVKTLSWNATHRSAAFTPLQATHLRSRQPNPLDATLLSLQPPSDEAPAAEYPLLTTDH